MHFLLASSSPDKPAPPGGCRAPWPGTAQPGRASTLPSVIYLRQRRALGPSDIGTARSSILSLPALEPRSWPWQRWLGARRDRLALLHGPIPAPSCHTWMPHYGRAPQQHLITEGITPLALHTPPSPPPPILPSQNQVLPGSGSAASTDPIHQSHPHPGSA